MQPADVDLDVALKLLSLPRQIGVHPDDGEPITANNGRFGPYVQHGKTYANLEAGDDLFHIGLNRAVTLIAEKIANPKKRRFGSDPGRSLGEHPDQGGAVVVKSGRYGPYVSHAGVNATLPKDKAPETITLEEALPLLAARAEYLASGGGKRPAKAKGKAATAAKTAADKPTGQEKGEAKAKAVKKSAAPPAKKAVTTAKKPAKTARAAPKAPARAPVRKPPTAAKAPPKRAKGGK
jgi:DNA topoisomerase-1